MKGTVVITLEDGTVLSGVVQLSKAAATSKPEASSASSHAVAPSSDALDFSLPLRPFMNDYSDGLSGSKKLALIVAHAAGGELDIPIDRVRVIDAWNNMTGLLGGRFNGAHESRAKDSGYIYVPEPGKFALLKKWRQAVS